MREPSTSELWRETTPNPGEPPLSPSGPTRREFGSTFVDRLLLALIGLLFAWILTGIASAVQP
ncbi:MAG: hypothetical protein KDE32_09995 [Novosphingobium sp.]|nr:hypothetical protein [Novosphingobium sp.]